jgi:hypothetical protein
MGGDRSPWLKPCAPGVDQFLMAWIDRLQHALRPLGRGEEGMALPFALFATVAAMGLASAAVISSVNVQQGSHRDSDAKSAIAAADAGANVALMRLNRYAAALSTAPTTNCLGISGVSLVVTGAVNGWCPPIEGAVGGATYRYQVSAMVNTGTVSVVATGTSGTVSRRIDVALAAESVDGVLKDEGLIGQDGIAMNGKVKIEVNIGTDGNIDTLGHSFEICGNARHGVGKTGPEAPELSCGGQPIEQNVSLPPVSSFIPPNIATENSNRRLEKCKAPGVPTECGVDPYNGTVWNPKTRTISASGQTTIALGGKDYWLCQLTLSGGSHLIMAANAHVRLFFDTPENCGISGPQISLAGNTSIDATSNSDMVGIYLLGSSTSTVSLGGTSGTNRIVLYAPDTAITIFGNAEYKGVIAGRTLDLSGGPFFHQDDGFEPEPIGGATLYSRQSYVECSGIAAVSPNENC